MWDHQTFFSFAQFLFLAMSLFLCPNRAPRRGEHVPETEELSFLFAGDLSCSNLQVKAALQDPAGHLHSFR